VLKKNSLQVSLTLIQAGLWEKEARLLSYSDIDFNEVFLFAQKHAVVGLIAAGLEYVKDVNISQEVALTFAGSTLQLEQRNRDMNLFLASMIEKMRKDNIYTILVKGQGIAQCYSRPLWRTSGDIDFFFFRDSYNSAVDYFKKLSSNNTQDSRYTKTYTVILNQWSVELHGTLRSGLSSKIDQEIDLVQDEVFKHGDVRAWRDSNTYIFLPGVDSDLYLLFTHFVRHFYHNEFLLRQTCDWCRFIWTYKDKINVDLLEIRLLKTNLMSEWKAFGAFVIDYLGMPSEIMPFYEDTAKWHKKAEKIMRYVNSKKKGNRVNNMIAISKIFPLNALRFMPSLLFNVNGMKIRERIFKL